MALPCLSTHSTEDGSHGRVYYGPAFTALKDRKKEIGRGLLHEMCSELGIGEKDLEGR